MARLPVLPRPPAALSAAVWRYGPLALIVGGALALIVAEFLTMREIRAVTAVPAGGRTTGGAHHGYALAIIGLAALPMGVGAVLGGSRPAAVAATALAAVALAIVLLADAPSLDDTGLIGRNYELAEARPGPGFWLEAAGAAALLGGGLRVLLRQRLRPARRRRPRTPDPEAPATGS